MDQPAADQSTVLLPDHDEIVVSAAVPAPANTTDAIRPAACATCGAAPAVSGRAAAAASSSAMAPSSIPSFVYAAGLVEPRFPSLSVEKEFAQAVARVDTKGLTDQQVLQKVVAAQENRYLARQMCWVMTIGGLETYILLGRESSDFSLLVETLRANPSPDDVDVVIGLRGRIAPPGMCNGLLVPVVMFDQIFSFKRAELIAAIPRPEKIPAKDFAATAEELFDRIMQMTDNAGARDEDRALNYLALRDRHIYQAVAEAHARNESLTAVDVIPSPLSGTRKILEVKFSFTNRSSGVVSKQSTGVDASDEFVFLQWAMRPTFDW
jgi:hypothetical protein